MSHVRKKQDKSYDGYTKLQAHSDWKDTIDRLLQCSHQGLLRKGKELQRKWNNNTYKYLDSMHWALQKRKRSAKLQSVVVTGLADASVNNTMKRMLQEESADLAEVPLAAQEELWEDVRVGCGSQGVPSTVETNLRVVSSDVARPTNEEVGTQRGTSRVALETEADQSAIVDNQDRDDLLASVIHSKHSVCDWIVEGKCMSCLFQEYQKVSIEALFAKEIKKVDVADAMATFGVFAPYIPTDRMRSVFGESRLEIASPIVRHEIDGEYDLCVLKALRMNDQRDEAFEALAGIKDRKIRVMFATLIEHLPFDKETRVAEETFVATYIAPIFLGTLRASDKISIHLYVHIPSAFVFAKCLVCYCNSNTYFVTVCKSQHSVQGSERPRYAPR
ncbi:hypothetical protein BGW38_003060 [Lunasporangiospora selenospora]|uniref:Uncharacterized protein n=1 Tax=Lunasporangiospora selenospora TaxID=979761 RepID=A0A9P6FRX4_9FUNG|nr:hypothetical protein BGW38_003060 [Lunasporangiospora selenospora]